MLIALTREVSPDITRCELTHLHRADIDYDRAVAQHAEYERCLGGLGCQVIHLPTRTDLPDSVFIEDTAVVVDELAVITRPGAASRRPEIEAVAQALGPYRRVATIQPPGTLDGGDVLRVRRVLHVGQSLRTNPAGTSQLERLVAPWGYEVRPVGMTGCLHLKTAATEVAEGVILLNPVWVRREAFGDCEIIETDPSEPFGANALRVGDWLLYAASFPKTLGRLRDRGIRVATVDASELAKAEGGVTCCSVIFKR